MSRRRKTAADQLGDGLDRRQEQQTEPEIIIVDADSPEAGEALTIDTTSGFHQPGTPAQNAQIVIDEGPTAEEVLARQYQERRGRQEDREKPQPIDDAALKAAEARAARAEAEARRYSEMAVAHELGYRDATKTALENALHVTQSNIKQAEQAYRAAVAVNDLDTVVQANRVIAENTAQAEQIKAAQRDFESSQPQIRPYSGSNSGGAAGGRHEETLRKFTPRSREWLENHLEILDDTERQIDAQAAHRLAERRGIPIDSDEYFAHMDEQLGFKPTFSRQDASRREATPRRGSGTVPAAPPSKSSFGSGENRNPNRIVLTKAQHDTALAMFSHLPPAEALAEYAKHALNIEKGRTNLQWSRDKYRGGPGV